MPRITVQVTMDLDRPVDRGEDARYLCASLEEGISNGWFDFLLNEEVFPAKLKRVSVGQFQQTTRPPR